MTKNNSLSKNGISKMIGGRSLAESRKLIDVQKFLQSNNQTINDLSKALLIPQDASYFN